MRDKPLDHFRSNRACKYRRSGLEFENLQLDLILLGFTDIRCIRDDQIERRAQTGEQVGLTKMDAMAELMASGVSTRNFKSSRRNIRGVNFGLRQLPRKCQSYCTRSCSDISNAQRTHSGWPRLRARFSRSGDFQDSFHKKFRFRSRNQHCRSHDEIHPPEFLVSRDVLCRNSSRTLLQSDCVARFLIGSEFPLRMRKEISTVAI